MRAIAELRAWQSEAFARWEQAHRGVVSVVTGGGKTLFALHCFRTLSEREPALRLAVIVPTQALLDQWAVVLNCDLGLHVDDIGTFSGEGQPRTPRRANVLVINTAREAMAQLTRDGPWMLVVDECHRAGSPMNSRALSGEYYAVLGLSATPQRQYDDGFATYIEPALGPVIYEYDYASARRDGVIVPFDIINVEFPMMAAEKKAYDRLTAALRRLARGPDGAIADAEGTRAEHILRKRARISIGARLRVPTAIAAMRDMRGKAIVFHERIAAAEEIALILNKTDRRPVVYHSQVPGPTRRDRLRTFRVGAADTLVTCRSLDEGLNVPDATLAVVVAATSSRRQRIQRLGRVLRTTTPEKRATVMTLFGTDAERKQLELEESRLADVASVRWLTAALT